MDDRGFDALSRRVGAMELARLPRRGLLGLVGSAALGSALGTAVTGSPAAAAKQAKGEAKQTKSEGKNKCKKEGKTCSKNKDCCKGKCVNEKCSSDSSKCLTNQDFDKQFGSGGSGNGQFNNPFGIGISKDNEIYVADRGNNRIQVFDANGNYQRKWGSSGTGKTQFVSVRGVAVVDSGSSERVFVSDPGQSGSRQLRRFDGNGDWKSDNAPDDMNDPFTVTTDTNNENIWVVDTGGRVFLFDRTGDRLADWKPTGSGDISGAQGIAVWYDKSNDQTFVFIARTGSSTVVKFEYVNNGSNGLKFVKKVGSFGDASDEFKKPADLAVDKCGNLWVSDTENNRIQKLDKDLKFKSRFTASMNNPTGIALDKSGKSLYVVDSLKNRVLKFKLS
ncbi:MAG: SMP-30/gluconolactonase/LRE family protein [Thermomicrobiales bacterium]